MKKPCVACELASEGYVVHFQGEMNRRALQTWLAGDKQTRYRLLNADQIWVPESAIPDLLDYWDAHMEPQHIVAAATWEAEAPLPPAKSSDWLSLADVRRRQEAHWIDAVIQEKRIKTVFQPIVRLCDGRPEIAGYELLSRAVAEDGSLIPPYRLFEAAKTRGRLFALDRVCRLQAVHSATQIRANRLAFVNFIPTAIYSPEHCLQSTLEAARKSGLDPRQFVFEVVETEEVDQIEHLEHILLYYRRHGFRYALDDVGQGYSTLEKVERLKPDVVKLDMQYVQGVAQDAEKQKTAKELLRTARAVGSIALAEGIETNEDWLWMREAGYELFQGYYFGKPEAEPLEI